MIGRSMRGVVSVGCVIVGLCVASVASGQNYKPEYRLSATLSTPFSWGHGAQKWADLAREKTNGRINIKVYPGQALTGGDQSKEFTALRQGVIDMAYAAPLNWAPQIAQLNVFGMPFLFPSYEAADRALAGALGAALFDIIRQNGAEPVAWGENGFREMSNSRHPVRAPADLTGLKIRVIGSPMLLDMYKGLGANPTTMSWADAQPALATGAIDGQENSLETFQISKLNQMGQKHITLWGAVYEPLVLAINNGVWNSWTPADRAAVKAAAVEAARYQVEMARKVGQSAASQIEQSGVTITRITPDQRKAFVSAAGPVYEKWKARIGPEVVGVAEKALAAN